MIVLGCILMASSLKAQDDNQYHRNFVGITLSELPFQDYRLSFEHRISADYGFRIELGYKPATRYFTDATIIDLGLNATGWCYRNTANWYYISLGYRYYTNKKKTLYLSPELFYKRMTADHIIFSWGLQNSETSINAFELQSMTMNCIGLNLLVGKHVRIRFCKAFHAGFDIFTGVSLREKFIHTINYGYIEIHHNHDDGVGTVSIPESDNPVKENTELFMPMLQFGVVFYCSWR